MKIEFNPNELLSFEKVISPATIKLVFFAAVGVKILDAFIDLIRLFHYGFDGYRFLGILTSIIFYAITVFLASQLLLALQQKFAAAAATESAKPEAPATPPPLPPEV